MRGTIQDVPAKDYKKSADGSTKTLETHTSPARDTEGEEEKTETSALSHLAASAQADWKLVARQRRSCRRHVTWRGPLGAGGPRAPSASRAASPRQTLDRRSDGGAGSSRGCCLRLLTRMSEAVVATSTGVTCERCTRSTSFNGQAYECHPRSRTHRCVVRRIRRIHIRRCAMLAASSMGLPVGTMLLATQRGLLRQPLCGIPLFRAEENR